MDDVIFLVLFSLVLVLVSCRLKPCCASRFFYLAELSTEEEGKIRDRHCLLYLYGYSL